MATERRECDPSGCANLQVMRKELETQSGILRDVIGETKTCITEAGKVQRELALSLADLKAVINGQAEALRSGTREFNIINDDLGRMDDKVHGLDTRLTVVEKLTTDVPALNTRLTVLETGGKPVNRSALGYGAGAGGVISMVFAILNYFLGG